MIHTPGQVFNYNDGASHLLSVNLSEASGIGTQEFAEQFLLDPLEIGQRPWAIDNRGYSLGCVALKLTPRDMMKLGMLYIQKGTDQGKRIVFEEWIDQSTRAQILTGDVIPYGSSYGFLWWIGRANLRDFYFANGYGGQFIFNVPGLNLVIVATCDWLTADQQADENWYSIISLMINQIMSAVR